MSITQRIVIIGYGTAGWSASVSVQQTSRRAEITVFEKRPYALYHPCSLPEVIEGKFPIDAIVSKTIPISKRLRVFVNILVEEIDVESSKVVARNLKTGEKIAVEYDRLILALGSVPHIPSSIEIRCSEGIYSLKFIEDGVKIERASRKYSRAIVVGGGALGIEVAYALAKKNLSVTLLEYFPHLMPSKLDRDFSKIVEKFLKDHGVEVVTGEKVVEIGGSEGDKYVATEEKVFRGDFVVAATGFKPYIGLAERIGVKIGEIGGIAVNSKMETSINGIYAAGDVAEIKDFLTNKPTLCFLASTAYLTGRVAGVNAAGGEEVFEGALQNWIVSLGDFVFGGVGITRERALVEGMDTVSAVVAIPDKPEYYPGASRIKVKLVVSTEGKVLGVQAIGGRRVAEILNMGALAIKRRMHVNELARLETAYTPSVSSVLHPLSLAAQMIKRKIK